MFRVSGKGLRIVRHLGIWREEPGARTNARSELSLKWQHKVLWEVSRKKPSWSQEPLYLQHCSLRGKSQPVAQISLPLTLLGKDDSKEEQLAGDKIVKQWMDLTPGKGFGWWQWGNIKTQWDATGTVPSNCTYCMNVDTHINMSMDDFLKHIFFIS